MLVRGRARSTRLGLWAGAACLLLGTFPAAAPEARAQDVVDLLRQQRRDARIVELARQLGPEVPAIRYEGIPTDAGSKIDAWLAYWAAEARAAVLPDTLDDRPPQLAEIRWAKVDFNRQDRFLNRFREVLWTTDGLNYPVDFDRTPTPELRARLGTLYGLPTRNSTAYEQEAYASSHDIQFEYWFIVNDSIPLLVMDISGPFGRGLMLAGDEAHQAVYPQIKSDLARRLTAEIPLTAYQEFFYSTDRRSWYRAGYDGDRYFIDPVAAPAWSRRRGDPRRWIIHR
ncbi:hypothetical protein BH23BAC4_BH23BAC4_14380 [soil metagenome]